MRIISISKFVRKFEVSPESIMYLEEVLQQGREVLKSVRGPGMRGLGHDVGEDLLDERRGLLLDPVDLDRAGEGEDDGAVQLLGVAVQDGRLLARRGGRRGFRRANLRVTQT